VDPDPYHDWIRIQWGPWIQIQEGKNDIQKWEKVNKFYFEVLDVLLGGLKASPVA
jgi:hypothetical protein